MKELCEIQKKLKAPKGQFNKFGNYKYRSCEDILEAVKPLLYEHGCSLKLSDDLVYVGDRYYIKATATITTKDGAAETVTAYAREEETKKGMDGSQITGTASSYARKYALNGLFCIDDTKDADTDEYTERTRGKESNPKKEPPKPVAEDLKAIAPDLDAPAPKAKINEMLTLVKMRGFEPKDFCAEHGIFTLKGITNAEVGKILAALN